MNHLEWMLLGTEIVDASLIFDTGEWRPSILVSGTSTEKSYFKHRISTFPTSFKMKKILGKAKSAFSDAQSQFSSSESKLQPHSRQGDIPSSIEPPKPLDVLRYRYHHGANLGGCFVLEKWLFPGMFEHATKGDSELDAVQAYVD